MDIINKYKEKIVSRLGDNLEALILVGSFARGEAVIYESNGKKELISDIEFWAVVKDLSIAKTISFDNNVSLGFTTLKHLRQLKPYIYTIEVKKFGKVLYGHSNILNLIPDYSYENIEPIDGFILLNNRIVEQLILLNRIEDVQGVNQYDFDKSYIQLVNSLLVFNRRYRSLYPDKQDEFRRFYKDSDIGLLNKVDEAFASVKQQSGVAIRQDEALKKWQEVREHFRKVWIREKRTLGKVKCWIKFLSLGKPLQFLIYQKAANLYFSDEYHNKQKRDIVIKEWKKHIK